MQRMHVVRRNVHNTESRIFLTTFISGKKFLLHENMRLHKELLGILFEKSFKSPIIRNNIFPM